MIEQSEIVPGLVSVVICAWNNWPDLEMTIESALHQSYQPIEVIVVDNSSTDATAEEVPSLRPPPGVFRATESRRLPEPTMPAFGWRMGSLSNSSTGTTCSRRIRLRSKSKFSAQIQNWISFMATPACFKLYRSQQLG